MSRLAVPVTEASIARQTESRLRELDRKTSGTSLGVESALAAARHHWHGSGPIDPGGITVVLTSWTPDVDDHIATLAAGKLTLTQPGRWSIWVQMTSDATVNGNSALSLFAQPLKAPWGVNQELRDERLRGSGYTNAGNLTQSIAWSGVVTDAQASSPLTIRAVWRNASGTTAATGSWWMSAHYMGAARLPDG